jgi:hypothetical protein
VIVYRNQRKRVATADLLHRVETSVGFERQMGVGILEAGVADALCPDYDRNLPVLAALRRGEWEGFELPREIEISVPEGFAYYALDPELYQRAALSFVKTVRPERVALIGIRAIGTTLSTIVAAVLRAAGCEVQSWTVRPHGHPWNRVLRIDEGLARAWREWNGWFAVVDEGPGLSGSSFASVSERLESLGIAPQRVVLFPSWVPDGSGFVSETARARWRLHEKFCVDFEDLDLFPGTRDIGGGKWRLLADIPVAAHPQHERRKYLNRKYLYKFAGYGHYGSEALERAGALFGWVPSCNELRRGFLSIEWVPGRNLSQSLRSPHRGESFLKHAARYLTHIRREFATGEPVGFEPLAELIAVNAPEAPETGGWRSAVLDGRAVALDGRMFPHEWIEAPHGYLKTDALDHHDDHFFPGPQDTAWDIAASIIEFHLNAPAEEYFVECYERESQDRGIRARLPFYRLAYLAFRFGYTDVAMHTLEGTEDGVRFSKDRARYRSLLELSHGS